MALRPLDKASLPHLSSINAAYMDTPFDRGNKFSVPYAYTLTLLGYNVQKMQELGLPTNSWAVIFEPRYLEKLKGRVTVLDSQRELIAAALPPAKLLLIFSDTPLRSSEGQALHVTFKHG